MDASVVLDKKIIAIIRGITGDDLLNTAKAVLSGGIELIEVTFDQSGKITAEQTASDIKMLKTKLGDRMHVGAGTVLTERQVRLAHKAGAEFIISPDTDERVIKLTKKLSMLSMPGALTPSEIRKAHDFGADFVKVFPCASLGSEYIKAVAAPLSHVRLLAVGGVTPDNMDEFYKAGACGFGISSSIANKRLADEGNFKQIEENARRFTEKL